MHSAILDIHKLSIVRYAYCKSQPGEINLFYEEVTVCNPGKKLMKHVVDKNNIIDPLPPNNVDIEK